jgi:NAD(P)-dependent dehydrogenase (short-subunit alcohol dehydrogenase family)
MTWTTADIGEWTGRRVVVTGANSGIGLETCRALVGCGAEVIMACRDLARAGVAADELRRSGATGSVVVSALDLADLSSVKRFTEDLRAGGQPIHGLVNNAGIMATPFRTTVDGFESQMGTNHFGHALLTARLLGAIPPGGRIVIVSSIAARRGKLTSTMTAEDLTSPAPYSSQVVYSNTKQANLLFAQELNRRIRESGLGVPVVAAHPGVAATELFARQLRDNGRAALVPIVRPVMRVVTQSPAAGAAPSLRALSDPRLTGGEFVGPKHLFQSRGAPELLSVYRQGADQAAAKRLFELTEELLGTAMIPA